LRGALQGLGSKKGIRSSFTTCRWCLRPLLQCWPVPVLGLSTQWYSEVSPLMNLPSASRSPKPEGPLSLPQCGIEVKKVIEYIIRCSTRPSSLQSINLRVVIFQRPAGESLKLHGRPCIFDWDELTAKAEPATCVPVKATDPLYVLYTVRHNRPRPKGIARLSGGHAVVLRWSLEISTTQNRRSLLGCFGCGMGRGPFFTLLWASPGPLHDVLYEGKPVGNTRSWARSGGSSQSMA